jgi:hypothetical protein
MLTKYRSSSQREVEELDAFQSFLEGVPWHEEDHVTLKETANAGTGVFATRDIKKGETVCYYSGAYVHWKQLRTPLSRSHAIGVSFEKKGDRPVLGMVVDGRTYAMLHHKRSDVAERLVRGCGPMLNSTADQSNKGNVEISKGPDKHVVSDQRFAAVPMRAREHIPKGAELRFYYDFKKDYTVDSLEIISTKPDAKPSGGSGSKKRRIALI